MTLMGETFGVGFTDESLLAVMLRNGNPRFEWKCPLAGEVKACLGGKIRSLPGRI